MRRLRGEGERGVSVSGMNVPKMGPAVPLRGNAVSRWIGRGALSIAGWRFEGEVPNAPKFVLIVAPHTSNWDFPLGVAALFALGFRASFMGKHTLFKGPFAIPMKWLGGVPVDRAVRRDRVSESVAAFNASEKLIMVIAPEGTRKYVPSWKTGFYHVAQGAGVSIVPVAFDFGAKVIRFGDSLVPTGDLEADIGELRQFFRTAVGRIPEHYQP